MLPLVVLPTPLGSFLYIWGTGILYYLLLRALIAQLLPGQWTARRQGIFLLLTLLATHRMFWALQINPMIFAAVAGAALALKNRRYWAASFLLAFAVHVKVWPLAAALLMIACWPKQLSWRFAAALLVVGALPLLVRPPQMVWQQYEWWFDVLFGRSQDRHAYHDAWTIWELIHSPVSKIGYELLQLITAALTLAACLWQKRRSKNLNYLLLLLLGIWASWQMIFGPATERNTFGVIGPITAWALVVAWEQRWWRGWMTAAFIVSTVLSSGAVERSMLKFGENFQSPESKFHVIESMVQWITAAHPIGIALFAVWFIGYAWRNWGEEQNPR
jgi:hypothetical protein